MTGSANNVDPSSVKSAPGNSGGNIDLFAVESITWYDAIEFCNRLSEKGGKNPAYSLTGITRNGSGSISAATVTMITGSNGYRLPTEMEWMWAAMGADKSSQPNTTGYLKPFAGSNGTNNMNDYARYNHDTPYGAYETAKVLPNELGLYDMSGNVFELCWDWYAAYPAGDLTDYSGAD